MSGGTRNHFPAKIIDEKVFRYRRKNLYAVKNVRMAGGVTIKFLVV